MYEDNNNTNNTNDDTNNNITSNGNSVKKTRGKQKIHMSKIEKDSDKMITFSKRRSGIYKKASELATLTGCEIGFLVFSPAGKAFSFADPSFDYIMKRFMGCKQLEPASMPYNMDGLRQARIDQLAERYNDVLEFFYIERKKEGILKGLVAGKPMNNWWNRSIDDVAPEEIQGLENAFLEVFNKVQQKKHDILMLSKTDDNNNNNSHEFVYDNNNNYDNNNVMNIDDAGGGGSVFSPFGMQQPTVHMEQINEVMSMGPTLLPSFPTVGPSEVVGSFSMVEPNGVAEAVDSLPIVEPSDGGIGVVDLSNTFSFSPI
ncbi:Agamous-like MADS-box protein AGL62 [Linum perenne]